MKAALSLFSLMFLINFASSASTLVLDFSGDEYTPPAKAVWRDRSGFSNNALGYGDNAPALASAVTPLGQNALQFNGKNFLYLQNEWKGADMEKFSTTPDFSVLAVVKLTPGGEHTSSIIGGRVGSLQYSISQRTNEQSLGISSVKPLGRSFSAVSPGEWTIVGVTYNGQTVNFYQNGEPAGTIDVVGSFVIPPKEAPFYIGKSHANNQFFDGQMAALRVYEGTLSPEEMKSASHSLSSIYISK